MQNKTIFKGGANLSASFLIDIYLLKTVTEITRIEVECPTKI